jgi:hypothetical protein
MPLLVTAFALATPEESFTQSPVLWAGLITCAWHDADAVLLARGWE